MAYMDHLGMIRQGNGPVETSPSVNGASTWSPWAGDRPGAYEEGFEPRNYAPHVPYLQRPGNQPKPAGPAAPSLYQPLSPQGPLTPPTMPTTTPPPQQSGGTGGGAGSGMGTYQTGIKSGLLSNDVISKARGALQSTAPMPGGATGPINPQQQASMQTQYDDLMRQGTQQADMGLTRDAAYQQAQMSLAQQKALAAAAAGGFSNLIGLDSQNTQFNTSNQAADISRRGLEQNTILRVLQGII